MIPPLPIRTRLVLAVAAVLLVTLVVSGMVLIKGTSDALVDQVDEQLRSYATRAQGVAPPPIGDLPPQDANEIEFFGRPVARLLLNANGSVQLSSPSGFPDHPDPLPEITANKLSQLGKKSTGIVTVPSLDGSIRYRALVQRESGGDMMVTAIPLTEIDAALSRLERNLLIIGALALVAATLACSWLIRRGLKPVDQMVDTATAIAQGDFSQRVPDTHPRTELGRLGQALNEMLQHIESALQARTESEHRLRQFVADAAHELR
ncbi:MAG TPA: HAMP domain-containing protein, partial [Thermomicrobiales bacterium]|nr:HAMP domain-containing protein [Thermomicrobiales bacterium]